MDMSEALAPIVVGIDGSPDSERALEWALRLAALEGRPLTLLHATDGAPVVRPRRGRPVVLDQAESAARRLAPEVPVHSVSCPDGPRMALIDASQSASLVVLGARGTGPLHRLRIGSVAHAVARRAECPVVITRTDGPGTESVLAGIDGGPYSARVLDFAFRMADAHSWPLTVLHCFWDDTETTGDLEPGTEPTRPEGRMAADAVRELSARHPQVEVRMLLARGFADKRLLEATLEHGLVIVGREETPWLRTVVYGHVTPEVVERAASDVAVVPTGRPPEVLP